MQVSQAENGRRIDGGYRGGLQVRIPNSLLKTFLVVQNPCRFFRSKEDDGHIGDEKWQFRHKPLLEGLKRACFLPMVRTSPF
jgi:hypothetical protein